MATDRKSIGDEDFVGPSSATREGAHGSLALAKPA